MIFIVILKKNNFASLVYFIFANGIILKIMKKYFQLLVIAIVFNGCKSTGTTPNEPVKSEPTLAYKQQIENLEEGIYFRGNGNEPDWNLKISEKTIEFTSSISGFESVSVNHVEPLQAMDANVKMYRFTTVAGLIIIQIMQQECVKTMSGDKSAYSVRIEIVKDNNSTFLSGCGNYITDYHLYDIWVLEQLNGKKVDTVDFPKDLPNLEINSYTNQFMGFAGCNRMNGIIFFERGLLRFTNTITTRMACGTNNKENEFLKALQSTTTYKVENLRLILTNQLGEVLVFKKVD
jgi:heat shock protein HslJ